MRFKTRDLIIESEKIGSVGYIVNSHKGLYINKTIFDLIFEPVEEESDKQETFRCSDCKREFLLEANPASIDSETEFICVDCAENIYGKKGS